MVRFLLCDPVLVPQINGELDPAFVTAKKSVKQLELRVASLPPALGAPLRILIVSVVSVNGPVIANVSKSNLNCKWKEITFISMHHTTLKISYNTNEDDLSTYVHIYTTNIWYMLYIYLANALFYRTYF